MDDDIAAARRHREIEEIWRVSINDPRFTAFRNHATQNDSDRRHFQQDGVIGDGEAILLAGALTNNTFLREIHFYACPELTGEGVAAIAAELNSSSSIICLDIRCCSIGEQGANSIARSIRNGWSPTTLILYQCHLESYCVVNILNSLRECNSSIQVLEVGKERPFIRAQNLENVEEWQWSDTDRRLATSALCDLVTSNRTIKDLRLDFVDHEGAKELATSLLYNQTLTSLTLYSCPIGDDGAIALANSLRAGSSVEILRLHGSTNIGDRGIMAIAETLSETQTLKELDLMQCGFGDEGGVALARALLLNSFLEKICLSLNNCGDETAGAFARVLEKEDSGLIHLDLTDNKNISHVGVRSFCQKLKSNKKLQNIPFDFEGVDGQDASECYEMVLDMLEGNHAIVEQPEMIVSPYLSFLLRLNRSGKKKLLLESEESNLWYEELARIDDLSELYFFVRQKPTFLWHV